MAEAKKKCSVRGCDNDAVARGYCNTHYQQWLRNRTVKPIGAVGQPTPYPGKRADKPVQVALTDYGLECLERGMKRRRLNKTNYIEELIREEEARVKERRQRERAAAEKRTA